MGTILIIGLGGVGNVTAQKCFQVPEIFDRIVLASRTLSKCQDVKKRLKNPPNVIAEKLDANNVEETVALIKEYEPEIVINTALPYQDLKIMEACLQTKTHYLDTANYEAPNQLTFSYSHQWKYHDRFKDAGIMALLGSGFDPGVTNVFIAYLKKHNFEQIETVDILDCNGGDHGHPFATNFNTEINIREITQKGKYWEGEWKETPPLSDFRDFDFPGVGTRRAYLMFHEEMESLIKHFPEIRRMRFWMTFSDQYLNHLHVLENVGMTSIEPVVYKGQEIVPLQFLDFILPTPASLGVRTKGKTCIGCLVKGTNHMGEKKSLFLYNNCDHEQCYEEVGSQAVSYTTGVPAMIGAKMIMEGKWEGVGTFCLEQLNPDPFMENLNKYGLPWQIIDNCV